jgi:DNA invertase Pin-like site-specific DNA recombinase
MKTAEHTQPSFTPRAAASRASSSKVLATHLDRQAVVYVRQSSPHQVLEHRESTARQYALADCAAALGWPRERVVIVDDDLGKSGRTTEGRDGFARLVTEVTLNHVGIIFGLEMSRLARSSMDWHALFEMCAVFGTLLADEDGVYDATDANDRLLLGLKGIMSEMELHIMRSRLQRGREDKAQRGDLFYGVPMGYVILPRNEVAFDPDEQAREVVKLLFDKFDELIYGLFHWLVRNDIKLPIRARSGANKGQLDWRRPTTVTLTNVLHHPIYAGAYAYGRRTTDAKNRFSQSKGYRPWLPMDQWKVLIKDRLPAYITWDQYLKNHDRIKQNQYGPESIGRPREGGALLAGLLVCGSCGWRMQPYYTKDTAHYGCCRHRHEARQARCYGLAARAIDELVAQQVLRALEPAALELSMKARDNVAQERKRLGKHWQQRLQRAGCSLSAAPIMRHFWQAAA